MSIGQSSVQVNADGFAGVMGRMLASGRKAQTKIRKRRSRVPLHAEPVSSHGGLDLLYSCGGFNTQIAEQVKQMRAMEAELGMYKQQVDLFKSDIEAANEAMRALRHRWVAQQRRNKNNQREGGADETTHTTASTWNSPTPAPASGSAESIPLLLQDGKGNSSGTSLEKGTLEGDIPPDRAVVESLPAVAAG